MALTAISLIYPAGQIQAGWFKDGEDPTTTVTAWIEAETTDDRPDSAVVLRVQARAYGMVADRIAATPMRRSYGGQGGKSDEYDKAQIAHWSTLRDAALEDAREIETGAAARTSTKSAPVALYSTW